MNEMMYEKEIIHTEMMYEKETIHGRDTTTHTGCDQHDQHVAVFFQQVAELLEEYLDSGDIDEAAQSLQELDLPRYDHWFVKRAITLAMDHHDREREMVSVLLSTIYSEVVSAEHMARGLHDVLDALDDLTLDVPDAADQLATFIARAVVDDILPPSFVSRLPRGMYMCMCV